MFLKNNCLNIIMITKIDVTDNTFEEKVIKQSNDKLVLVDFWAPWCAPCKMVAPILNEIAEENSNTVTIAKVNVDQNQQISQKYNVRNIPTMILFKDGKVMKRITGVKPKKILLKEIGV